MTGIPVGPLSLRIMDALLEVVASGEKRASLVQVSQHVWNGLIYENKAAVSSHCWDGNVAAVPVELNPTLPDAWGRMLRGDKIIGAISFDV